MKSKLLNSFYIELVKFRESIKLIHFTTEKYSLHKATDELINDIDEIFDKLIESYVGYCEKNNIDGRQELKILFNNKIELSDDYIMLSKNVIIMVGHLKLPVESSLNNILDNLVNSIEKFLYLTKLN